MMNKLLQSCTSTTRPWCTSTTRPWCNYSGGISRAFRVLSYSTQTLTSSAPNVTLYNNILRDCNPKVSIVPIVEEWIRQEQRVDLAELQKIIKQLRTYRRFNQALELSEWMNNKRYLDLLPGDVVSERMSNKRYLDLLPGNVAVQLDLISKVHGLEQAEKYFSTIPDTLRVFQVYGALLNCYAYAKSLEKAEAIMQKMKELGSARTLSYNVMLKLYSQMGQHMKLDSLIQEMEEKGITCDKFTFNIRLNAYATATDIKGMERLLLKMEADPLHTMDWNAYAVAANGYLKANLVENALAMLKKLEQLIKVDTKRFAYEIPLTLYASMGKKDEVYHIWNLYKKTRRFFNSSYFCMIRALVKLDDLDGAEKIFKDWEKENKYFDFQVPNFLITSYCRKGLLVEAESIVDRLIESGKEINASTWDRLAVGYHKFSQMAKAVEAMKKAISASHSRSKLNYATLVACLGYLKGKGDMEEVEELVNLLKEKGQLPTDIYIRLDNYMQKGNSECELLDQMGGSDQNLEGEMLGGMELKYED